MKKFVYKKIFLILLIIFIFFIIFIFYGLSLNKKYYRMIFRLSSQEVTYFLNNKPFECLEINKCNLKPGDILIRRFITPKTEDFATLLNPYYIHSAVYMGEGKVFEALGDDLEKNDQVSIRKIEETDWVNPKLKNFVILRPNYNEKLNAVLEDFKNMAEKDNYVFGFAKENHNETTCADAIVKVLYQENIIKDLPNEPEIITPDYLFMLLESNEDIASIIGYNLD